MLPTAIQNERVIFFDVDNTLVLPANEITKTTLRIIDPYDGEIRYREPHFPHMKLLRNYNARKAFVVVWSKNGYQWATAVINALGLTNFVDLIMTKPCVYVDDEPPVKWMGEHVFIPSTDSFGQEKINDEPPF